MLNEYKPTPQQIVEALKALGYEESFDTLDRPDGVPTEEDYPDLVGYLLAMAEVTACNVLTMDDNDAVLEAYQGVFIPDIDDDDVGLHETGFQEFLITLTEASNRVRRLNAMQPFADHGEMDHPLADAASLAAYLSGQLSNLRLAVNLAVEEEDEADRLSKLAEVMPLVPGYISAAAQLTAMLAALINPHEHHHHDDVELCDEHRQELYETLEGIEDATEEAQLPEESRKYNAALDRIRAAGGELAERLEARLAKERETAVEDGMEAARTNDYTTVQAKHEAFKTFVFALEAELDKNQEN